jgi:hypothetical protein
MRPTPGVERRRLGRPHRRLWQPVALSRLTSVGTAAPHAVVWFLICFVLFFVFCVFSFEDRDDHTLSQDTPILHGDVAPVTFEQQLAALRFGTPAVA